MNIKTFLVIIIMLILANLSFITNKRFLIFPVIYKNIKIHLIEWILSFIIFLLLAFGLESLDSRVYHQGKTFYLSLLCLYIVFSSPGFIIRYLFTNKKNNKG